MYIVGSDRSPGTADTQWRIEKRSIVDGSLVTTFGSGGVVTNDYGIGYDWLTDIAIDANFMYIVGSNLSPGSTDSQWRIEKRSLADGSLVDTFGSGGVVTNNPSASHDGAYAIAIDANFMYIAGEDRSPGSTDPQWRIEKRSLSDGSLVTTFGSDGSVTNNTGTCYDGPSAIAVDASYLYVVGSACGSSIADFQWRIEKRTLADGSLVGTFGSSGVVTNNISAGSDYAAAIAIDSSSLYVVGRDSSPGSTDSQWRIEKRLE